MLNPDHLRCKAERAYTGFKIPRAVFFLWPFIQVDSKSGLDETPHHAHIWQKIEYVCPLDRSGYDQNRWLVFHGLCIAAQSKTRTIDTIPCSFMRTVACIFQ